MPWDVQQSEQSLVKQGVLVLAHDSNPLAMYQLRLENPCCQFRSCSPEEETFRDCQHTRIFAMGHQCESVQEIMPRLRTYRYHMACMYAELYELGKGILETAPAGDV